MSEAYWIFMKFPLILSKNILGLKGKLLWLLYSKDMLLVWGATFRPKLFSGATPEKIVPLQPYDRIRNYGFGNIATPFLSCIPYFELVTYCNCLPMSALWPEMSGLFSGVLEKKSELSVSLRDSS